MTTPIILHNNILLGSTLTATDTASGFSVLNIRDYRTYTFWQAASAGTKHITVDCGLARPADALGIISHNLATANATVSVASSTDNIAWTTRLTGFIPSSDRAILRTFLSASARFWRLTITTASIAPRLAVAFLGTRLTFPWPPDSPYIPYSESVEVGSSRSKKGHILGSVVKYKPIRISARFSNLTRTWVETVFTPFWDNHASNLLPFFYAWSLTAYPNMVFYVSVEEGMAYRTPVSVLPFVDSLELEMEGIKE